MTGATGGTPLVAVVGATGTGKSAYAIALAVLLREHGRAAEIVNADAMQLYRGMDVGTAKVPVADRADVPHHLFDVLAPTEEATVAGYQPAARAAIAEVLDRGAVPILVGGSGLYVSSVVYEFDFPARDPEVRARLEAELAASGPGALHARLATLDPTAAAAIDARNGRRVVRALEVVEVTGAPFGAGLPDVARTWRDTEIVGLTAPRDVLVPRLDARAAGMWRDGLLDEVRALEPAGFGVTAARAIGYAQALAQLRGELDESGAIEQTAALTRRYARRQVSWFRRYAEIRWLDATAQPLPDAADALVTRLTR
jgi:tRNA dimethylallyltransferase